MTAEWIRKQASDTADKMIACETLGKAENARHLAITSAAQWLGEIAAQLAEINERARETKS